MIPLMSSSCSDSYEKGDAWKIEGTHMMEKRMLEKRMTSEK